MPETVIAPRTKTKPKIERPKLIEIRTELPKTFVGKLSRKELVEEEAGKAGAAAR